MPAYNEGFAPQCRFEPSSCAGGIAMSQNLDTIPEFATTGPFSMDTWPSSINHVFDASSRYSLGLGYAVGMPLTQAVTAPDFPNNITESQWANSQQSCQANHRSNEAKPISPSLLCNWPECNRTGPFCNKGALNRHIKTQHLAPRSFKCHHYGCLRSFNRKDNLDQHLRSGAHWRL